jgi:hypothetical protein
MQAESYGKSDPFFERSQNGGPPASGVDWIVCDKAEEQTDKHNSVICLRGLLS